jgi:hypothetical protein
MWLRRWMTVAMSAAIEDPKRSIAINNLQIFKASFCGAAYSITKWVFKGLYQYLLHICNI